MSSSFQPLQKIKILDLSRLLPGPFCTYLLKNLGAEITAIDSPYEKEVLTFPVIQKGKKRILLDLKSFKGKKQFEKLVQKSDVVFEGFRPGVLDRLGLGFKNLKKINPKIILCSLTGYGQKKPKEAGHDLNYLSLSGVLSSLSPGARLPSVPGLPLADLVGGMSAAVQILSALTIPKNLRKAVHLDVSICEAIHQWNLPFTGKVKKEIRSLCSGNLARYRLYETQDQKVLAVAALEEKFWKKFVEAIHLPTSIVEAGEQSAILWLKNKFREKSRKEWLKILKDPDLCVTPVL